MYNVQERYFTQDKKEHLTSDKAKEHVSDLIHAKIDKVLQEAIKIACDGQVARSAQIQIVEHFYEKRQSILDVVHMESFGDDGKDWNE